MHVDIFDDINLEIKNTKLFIEIKNNKRNEELVTLYCFIDGKKYSVRLHNEDEPLSTLD